MKYPFDWNNIEISWVSFVAILKNENNAKIASELCAGIVAKGTE